MSLQLEALYKRSGREYNKGDLIFKEGMLGEELFIILSGKVEIVKKNAQGKNVVLANLSGGDFFGEMAILQNALRTATAKAIEDTKVVVLNKESFLKNVSSYPQLSLVILRKMSERLQQTSEKLSPHKELDSNGLLKLSREEVVEDTLTEEPLLIEDEEESKVEDDKYFWKRELKCPKCKEKFTSLSLRKTAFNLVSRDTDFCPHYEGINPLHYAIHACPNCLYAGYQPDFTITFSTEIKNLRENFHPDKNNYKNLNFSDKRKLNEVIASYELALLSYKARKTNHEKRALIHLRLAWFNRDNGDVGKETEHYNLALKLFIESYEKDNLNSSKLGTVGISYLIGELNRRLGNHKEAVRWFSQTVTNPQIKGKREIERLARDEWMETREELKKIKTS